MHTSSKHEDIEETTNSPSPWQKFAQSFKETFPPDGYDSRTGFTYPNIPTKINNKTSELGMCIAAFLGFPSRPEGFINIKNDQAYIVPHLTLKQFLKGFIGGFDWAENTCTQKKFLQIFPGLLIKFGIILPFKVATWPLKLAVNISKLLVPLARMAVEIISNLIQSVAGLLFLLSVLLPAFVGWVPFIAGTLITGINYIAYIVINIAMLCAELVAIFALSPLKTMKGIYHFFDTPIIALTFSALSLIISATIWAIAIPILFSAAIALFPGLVGAIAFVTHIPLIATLLAASSGTFIGLSASVGTFFASYSVYWAGVFGVTLSSSLISVAGAATIGFFAALIAVPSCYIADALSDRWAAWHTGSFLKVLLGPAPPSYPIITTETNTTYTYRSPKTNSSTFTQSRTSEQFAQKTAGATGEAFGADGLASAFGDKFDAVDTFFDDFFRDKPWGQHQTRNRQATVPQETPRVEVLADSDEEKDRSSDNDFT